MDRQEQKNGLAGVFGQSETVGRDELSEALANLRAWVDPFALAWWVEQEAELTGCNSRMPEMFDHSAESSPRVILCVLAFSYTVGVCSSEEIVRNCQINSAYRVLGGGNYLLRQELIHFRRRHRRLLIELLARIFRRAIKERFSFADAALPASMEEHLRKLAVERLDIARHLDAIDE